jgi:hypothetical protein
MLLLLLLLLLLLSLSWCCCCKVVSRQFWGLPILRPQRNTCPISVFSRAKLSLDVTSLHVTSSHVTMTDSRWGPSQVSWNKLLEAEVKSRYKHRSQEYTGLF